MRHLLLISLLCLACACSRDEGLTVTTRITGEIPPPEIITTSVTTVVIDQDGNPLSDATITGVGASRVNPDGSLTIDAGNLSSDGSLVTVSSPGHWPERKVLMPSDAGELLVTFVMEAKVQAGEIDPTAGGTVRLADNFSVTLPPNSLVRTADGAAYSGPVAVFINHDAPEDRAEMLNSPGNALARLPDGSLASLESYGMMDIALEAPDGRPLLLDPATPAEVRMPLLPSTTPVAPDPVDFWMLDEDGFWLPAGSATLGPDCYIVFITAGGGYNCDVPRPAARMCAKLVNAAGLPITHLPFSIDITGGFSCWNATLDCEGAFCAWVAADTDLQLVVTDECTGEPTVLDVAPIPAGQQFDAGELVLDFTQTAFVATVTGCGGAGLPNPQNTEVWINGYGSEGGFVSTQAEGTAFVSLPGCGNEAVVVQAFTRDYRAASRPIRRSGPDASPQPLEVCGELEGDEAFSLAIDGVAITINELAAIYWPDNGNFDWLVRAGGTLAGEEYSLLLRCKDPAGGFGEDDLSLVIYRLLPGQQYGQGRVYVDPTASLTLTNVQYDANNGMFAANYGAALHLQNDVSQTVEAANLPVAGSFRIRL